MKESSLKTTKKRRYSRNKFSKIPNYYINTSDENSIDTKSIIDSDIVKIDEEFPYIIKILPSEKYTIQKYFEKNNISYEVNLDWTLLYLTNENDVKTFFNEVRGKRKIPLYILLKGLLYNIQELENNIKTITILSSTERYIQKYKTNRFKGLFNTVLMLFKMISVYKLHCYCQYKLTKNGLLISLIHSPYSKNIYNEKRKEEIKK